jgi:hypothetical protein
MAVKWLMNTFDQPAMLEMLLREMGAVPCVKSSNRNIFTAMWEDDRDHRLIMVMNLYSSPQSTEITAYGKNGEIRSYEEKVTSGKLKGFVGKKTYNWKDGKMVKLTGTRSEPGSSGDDSFDTKFTYKGKKVVKSHSTERYFNEKGEPESYDQDIRYTYKDGKVVKAEGMITTTYKYDKKGNLLESKVTIKLKDGTVMTPGFYKAKITYKNKRVHKKKISYKTGMMDKAVICNQTISYKKVKVSKSVADKVAAQQWRLVNDNGIDGIPW